MMLNFITVFSDVESPTLPQTHHTSSHFSVLFSTPGTVSPFLDSSAFQAICIPLFLGHSLHAFFIVHIIGYYSYLFDSFLHCYEHLKDFIYIMTSLFPHIADLFMIVLQYITKVLVHSRSSKELLNEQIDSV